LKFNGEKLMVRQKPSLLASLVSVVKRCINMVQFSQAVVSNEGQGSTADPDLDSAIRILADIKVFPPKMMIFFIILKQIKLYFSYYKVTFFETLRYSRQVNVARRFSPFSSGRCASKS